LSRFVFTYVLGLALKMAFFNLVFLCACSSEGDTSFDTALVIIRGPDGETPKTYTVAITYPDDLTLRISCPGGQESTFAIECDDSGVLVSNSPDLFTATVKSRGLGFVTDSFDAATASSVDGRPLLEIDLLSLSQFIVNDDYVTGYEERAGLEQFVAMSELNNTEMGPTRALKFYIGDLLESPKVYFINTQKYALHYDFVHEVLDPDISHGGYDKTTYKGEDRTGIAGTVVIYETVRAKSEAIGLEAVAPIAVTFFPTDNLTPAQAAVAHRLIEERIGFASLSGGEDRVIYLPAGENQEEELAKEKPLLARLDVPWIHREELYGNETLQILNPGVAYGSLIYLTPEELEKTIVSYTDILVLSRLPNTLPVVGGTITEELQTPLSHVNLAARSRGTPNIALLAASDDERVAPFLGKLVRFQVLDGEFKIEETTIEEAQAFWESRTTSPVVPDMDVERDGLPGFEELGFADSISVGAKAANLAEVVRVLGDSAPKGFAVPFHYYDAFVQGELVSRTLCDDARVDCVDEGRNEEVCNTARSKCLMASDDGITLWQFVLRLLNDEDFLGDSTAREADLDGLRYQIRHIEIDPDFATKLDNRVTEVFGDARVRLRSSTNAEDLANFSGAGLYSSVSAYGHGTDLASGDIRKVWASVWNWRAFEERAFWNIDHLAVRMGVAVNQSFPDEAANGVLITRNIADPAVSGMYVNVQLGEVSVTNPEEGALPEIFSIIPAPTFDLQVARLRYSSLSPEEPILTEQEIVELYAAAYKLQVHFAPFYKQSPFFLALDLEFKFHGPLRDLFIKQARPYISAKETR
jgi:Pyruvate phosphate dikinase, AMP/ATP-binding domain